MKSAIKPVPLLLFLSVIALITAFWIYAQWGASPFLAATGIVSIIIGWIIGLGWRLYPWQIGLVAAIPSVLFVAWRFYTAQTDADNATNISLFIFHPLLVIVLSHFGGLIGRWQTLRRKTRT